MQVRAYYSAMLLRSLQKVVLNYSFSWSDPESQFYKENILKWQFRSKLSFIEHIIGVYILWSKHIWNLSWYIMSDQFKDPLIKFDSKERRKNGDLLRLCRQGFGIILASYITSYITNLVYNIYKCYSFIIIALSVFLFKK